MWLAPIRTNLGEQKKSDLNSAMVEWKSFVEETEAHYGVDMSVLTAPFTKEHEKYFLQVRLNRGNTLYILQEDFDYQAFFSVQTSMWNNVHPDQVVGDPVLIKNIDCKKATVDEIRTVAAEFSSLIRADRTLISGYAGWFDVQFRVSYSAIHTNIE